MHDHTRTYITPPSPSPMYKPRKNGYHTVQSLYTAQSFLSSLFPMSFPSIPFNSISLVPASPIQFPKQHSMILHPQALHPI